MDPQYEHLRWLLTYIKSSRRVGVLERAARAVQLAPPMTSLFLMFQIRVHVFNFLDMSNVCLSAVFLYKLIYS